MHRKIMMTSEKHVKRECKKIINKFGFFYYMPPASVYGKGGISDFVCCINGRYVAIETKRPDVGKKGLTPLQLAYGRNVIKNGGEYLVVWNLETLEQLEKKISLLAE